MIDRIANQPTKDEYEWSRNKAQYFFASFKEFIILYFSPMWKKSFFKSWGSISPWSTGLQYSAYCSRASRDKSFKDLFEKLGIMLREQNLARTKTYHCHFSFIQGFLGPGHNAGHREDYADVILLELEALVARQLRHDQLGQLRLLILWLNIIYRMINRSIHSFPKS